MKLPISKRLLACAAFVEPGQRVADVGTDHGYLAIYLLQSRRASRVLAADVAPQPLARARENARRFGVREGLSFHQCDGVRGLPRDFDVLLMAGLGAETMVGILRGGPWLRSGGYRLVLQCQSSQNELRQYLSEAGWSRCGTESSSTPSWRQSQAARVSPRGSTLPAPPSCPAAVPWWGNTWPSAARRWKRWCWAWRGWGDPNMNTTARL